MHTKYIKLDKPIGCEYVCKQIDALVKLYKKDSIDLNDHILVITIKPISSSITLESKDALIHND